MCERLSFHLLLLPLRQSSMIIIINHIRCIPLYVFLSVGCGGTKGAVSSQVYSVLENTIVAKNKAERDLQTYTNLVSSLSFD